MATNVTIFKERLTIIRDGLTNLRDFMGGHPLTEVNCHNSMGDIGKAVFKLLELYRDVGESACDSPDRMQRAGRMMLEMSAKLHRFEMFLDEVIEDPASEMPTGDMPSDPATIVE